MIIALSHPAANLSAHKLFTYSSLRYNSAGLKLNHHSISAFHHQICRTNLFNYILVSSISTRLVRNDLQTSSLSFTSKKMSDDAYSSFLDKANQDTGASKTSTQTKSVSTKAVDTEIPATLKSVEQYYTSEADEPFEPVSLKWSGKNMPSESTFVIPIRIYDVLDAKLTSAVYR